MKNRKRGAMFWIKVIAFIAVLVLYSFGNPYAVKITHRGNGQIIVIEGQLATTVNDLVTEDRFDFYFTGDSLSQYSMKIITIELDTLRDNRSITDSVSIVWEQWVEPIDGGKLSVFPLGKTTKGLCFINSFVVEFTNSSTGRKKHSFEYTLLPNVLNDELSKYQELNIQDDGSVKFTLGTGGAIKNPELTIFDAQGIVVFQQNGLTYWSKKSFNQKNVTSGKYLFLLTGERLDNRSCELRKIFLLK